jgi:hypothetical protein
MSYNFKVGDQVKITRTAKRDENGWKNGWVAEMDSAVGKIGTVKNIYKPHRDINVEISGIGYNYGYPDFVLAPAKHGFAIGDRVTAPGRGNFDGKCTVTNIDDDYVHIRNFEGEVGGFYPRNIKLITQSAEQAVKPAEQTAKQLGITSAVSSHSKAFIAARLKAIELAKRNFSSLVNADDVQAEIVKLGYTSADLGNAAGAIFRGSRWQKAGTVKSTRRGNHLREITQWKYVGA